MRQMLLPGAAAAFRQLRLQGCWLSYWRALRVDSRMQFLLVPQNYSLDEYSQCLAQWFVESSGEEVAWIRVGRVHSSRGQGFYRM